LAEDAFLALMLVVRRMAPVLAVAYQPRKVGMLAAGFDVAHAHIHVLPLYEYHDITSKALLEGRRATPSEQELRMAAEHIQQGLRVQGNAASNNRMNLTGIPLRSIPAGYPRRSASRSRAQHVKLMSEEGEQYGNQGYKVAHHFVECLGMWKARNASNGAG
jgi:hypothetical protein